MTALRRTAVPLAPVVVLAAGMLAACGGGGVSSPSDEPGVVLRGTVLDSAASAATALSATSAATVTVTVAENQAITTAVGADGGFMLRGLPAGRFTLVFASGGAEIGRLVFDEVKPNQEITLAVRVGSGGVTVIEERRNGIGHGDVEVEGTVGQVLALDPSADSRFLVNGKTVVARPGQTAIREGNRSRSVVDVTAGRRVHVKGVWLAVEGSTQPVLALEIKLQGPADNDEDDDPPAGSKCVAAGSKAEVEGKITDKGGSSVTVAQQGKGDFVCEVSGGTRIRKGNTAIPFADLKTGWRVHVSGRGLGASGSMCRVSADEIKVQNDK